VRHLFPFCFPMVSLTFLSLVPPPLHLVLFFPPPSLASPQQLHSRLLPPRLAINAAFAAFLRTFGFRVSELVGRTFKSLGNDPLTHPDGWKWGTFTHELLVVDWEGSERWLVDGAWGPRSLSVPFVLFPSLCLPSRLFAHNPFS
jgi:hypothetical protein